MEHSAMINISYFCDGVYEKPSPVDHLWIYISCPCWRAPLYHPVLILARLSGVSGLVV